MIFTLSVCFVSAEMARKTKLILSPSFCLSISCGSLIYQTTLNVHFCVWERVQEHKMIGGGVAIQSRNVASQAYTAERLRVWMLGYVCGTSSSSKWLMSIFLYFLYFLLNNTPAGHLEGVLLFDDDQCHHLYIIWNNNQNTTVGSGQMLQCKIIMLESAG